MDELLKSYKANYTREGGVCLASPSLIRIKQKKEMLLLIPENTGDRVFSVRKTKITTEYREKGIRRFKNLIFQMYQFFFYLLSIQHIPFDEYNNFRHFHLTIIVELFRGRSLLRNSTLIASHLTVL